MRRREFLQAVAIGGVGVGTVSRLATANSARPINVLVWDEQQDIQVKSGAYKNFLGNAIAEFLGRVDGLQVVSANINEPDQGLSDSRINVADVILWWGHARHKDVDDSKVATIVERVKAGKTGFVALHSAHYSKPFKALMGTNCGFRRVDSNQNKGFAEQIRVVNPSHPIAEGVKDFEIPKTEIYAEPFEVPMPEGVVLYGRWATGEAFPDCCFWTVGPKGVPANAKEKVTGGRVVYFRPGHETFPIFHQPEIQHIVTNIVRWVSPIKPTS